MWYLNWWSDSSPLLPSLVLLPTSSQMSQLLGKIFKVKAGGAPIFFIVRYLEEIFLLIFLTTEQPFFIIYYTYTHFRYKRFMLNEKASKTMWCWWNKAAFIEKLEQVYVVCGFFYSNSTCINKGLRVCRKQSEKICYTLNFPALYFPCSQDK